MHSYGCMRLGMGSGECVMELVSIVVPVYKVEQYLDQCVQSIRNQTWKELEIILVDDGSPDQCGEMCEGYKAQDQRIVVIHKPNGGLGDARNEGAKAARGKYLLFVDSDDHIAEDLVEKTIKAARETDSDIVLFDYYYVENGKTERRSYDIPPGRALNLADEKELLLAPPASWIKLFCREFYEKAGIIFPTGIYYEDLATTPQLLLEADRIVYLDEPLYYYVNRRGSIMGSKDYERNCRDIVRVLNRVIRYYKEKGMYGRYKDELEYLAFLNVYFEPSKRMALSRAEKTYLLKAQRYIFRNFPDFRKNPYVRKMTKKDKIHMYILNTRQYWGIRLLSRGRQAAEGIREAGRCYVARYWEKR